MAQIISFPGTEVVNLDPIILQTLDRLGGANKGQLVAEILRRMPALDKHRVSRRVDAFFRRVKRAEKR
jgi:hypothetical protein